MLKKMKLRKHDDNERFVVIRSGQKKRPDSLEFSGIFGCRYFIHNDTDLILPFREICVAVLKSHFFALVY